MSRPLLLSIGTRCMEKSGRVQHISNSLPTSDGKRHHEINVPVSPMTLNGIMSTYPPLKVSPEEAVYYACSSIYYTHRKIIVHILSENGTSHESKVECSAVCCFTTIDQAVFATSLEKYTSYVQRCNLKQYIAK